jgi:tRNA U38,U39,U40 pseudouridine synthase TruA
MKKIKSVLALLMVFLLSNFLSAQSAETKNKLNKEARKEAAVKEIQKMKEDLALTDDQVSKIKTLFESRRNDGQKRKDMTKEERKSSIEEMNEAMKGILDENQYEKYRANMKNKAKKIREKRGGRK